MNDMERTDGKSRACAAAGKSCGETAKELYRDRGNEFCVGLILHLIMYISGNYEEE